MLHCFNYSSFVYIYIHIYIYIYIYIVTKIPALSALLVEFLSGIVNLIVPRSPLAHWELLSTIAWRLASPTAFSRFFFSYHIW
jgi:hypothetical protein